jgi:hypothetical protein
MEITTSARAAANTAAGPTTVGASDADAIRAVKRHGVVAVALVCGCAASSPPLGTASLAIVGGTLDQNDPAVVDLAAASCSGTVIAPRVVVTAAHCDIAAGSGVAFADGTSIPVLAVHKHPQWQAETATNDIAVVVLATPTSVAAMPLFTGPLDDSFIGRAVRIVGYGTAGDGGAAGIERSGTTTIRSYLATTFEDDEQPSGTCAGDSGGPALITVGGVEQLAGVTSRGDGACRQFGVETRVDAYVASFLAPAIAATTARSLPAGASCDDGAECQSDLCITASDSDLVRYCSLDCTTATACPSPMVCDGGVCRFTPPSPGALGAPCAAASDCAGGACAARSFGGAQTCSVDCQPGASAPCPAGYVCASAARPASGMMCFPAAPAASGCAIGSGGAPDPNALFSWMCAAALALAMARRRRYAGGAHRRVSVRRLRARRDNRRGSAARD